MDTTVTHLTDATFADAVSDGLTVVDFWASWCGPCRAMAPQFERAAKLRPGYRFAKVDVDAEPVLAAKYGIRSIPTLMVLRDGDHDPGREDRAEVGGGVAAKAADRPEARHRARSFA